MRHILQKTIFGILLVLLLAGMGWFNLKVAEGQGYTVKAEHPRLILTSEKFAQVVAKVQANDPDWQSMYSSRYSFTSGEVPYKSYIADFCLKWALLYKITNESIFLDRIKEVLWDYSALDNFNYQGRNTFRASGASYVEVYDWLYYDWTPREREDYIQHIITWASYWRNYVGYDNNFAGYRWEDSDETKSLALNFLAMGTALFGHHEDAPIFLDIADQMWRYIETNWWPKMGGVPIEGVYYGPGTRRYALQYLLLLNSSQYKDLSDYSTATVNMLNESVHFLLYSTSPDLEWAYPFGDMVDPYITTKTNRTGRIYMALELLELLKGTESVFYLREWIDSVSDLPFDSESRFTMVEEMLFNDRLAPKLSYGHFSKDKAFEMGKMIFSRSSWNFSQNTVWWGFQYSKHFVDHMNLDMLSYQIVRGDDFVTKEVGGYMGPSHLGRAHNTVLVENEYDDYSGGGGGFTDGECELKSYIASDDYVYINVDASLAYSGYINPWWESSAEKVARKFLNLKPNLFVVFDIVKTKDDYGNAATKAISNHFINEPIITDNTISSYEGNSRIFVKYLLPESVDLKITKINETEFYATALDYQVPNSQKKWHTITESISNPSLVHFIHIIEGGDIGLAQMKDSVLIQTSTNNMTGAKIGNQIVMFSNNVTKNQLEEPIIYSVSGQGASKHLIVDLKPNTTFTITNTNLDTNTQVSQETKVSSNRGTLYFETILSSTHQITITPGGQVPVVRGDVNGDGQVNVVDVQLAVNQFLGIIPQTTSADLNADDRVDVIDVQLLVNIILGG